MHRAIGFGVRWDSDVRLREFAIAAQDDAPTDIIVRQIRGPLAHRPGLVERDNARLCTDGVRFVAGRAATFDTFGPARVDWMQGEAWTGAFPPVFFSTITALVLAWRGGIPVHGTAVAVDGNGVLICGKSGAGKSSLAAGLIAAGAKLISDDLSILHSAGAGRAPVLYAGRCAMRLFPAVAAFLSGAAAVNARDFGSGDKHAVRPPRVGPLEPIPLTHIIRLGGEAGEVLCVSRKAALVHEQLFRPQWMQALPGRNARLEVIQSAAQSIRLMKMPAVDARNSDKFVDGISFALKNILT